MRHVPIAILGAGVAGLGAALRARELNFSSIIFEATSRAGGLLDNFMVDGFRFDNAVHLSFANEPEVRRIFDGVEYLTHPADSKCFDNGNWLKHPVQNNLYPLKPEKKVELIKSFLSRPHISNPENYKEWLLAQYGHEIAHNWPIAYTYKYWDSNPEDLSINWIGNRMRRAEIDEILFGAFTAETKNTYYAKEMRYPLKGGYKNFIQPLINDANIELNSEVVGIDADAHCIYFSNGLVVNYDKLISSIPLPILVNLLKCAPDEVILAAATLEATSIDLISVGFNVFINFDLWFYIYDKDIYASRAYSPSAKSLDNVPMGCSSLQFEIYQKGRNPRFTVDELKENVRYALQKMGLCENNDIQFFHHKRVPWGNVIFDLGMEQRRQVVHDYLNSCDISTCGRFGEWDYLWSNQSFLSGYRSL